MLAALLAIKSAKAVIGDGCIKYPWEDKFNLPGTFNPTDKILKMSSDEEVEETDRMEEIRDIVSKLNELVGKERKPKIERPGKFVLPRRPFIMPRKPEPVVEKADNIIDDGNKYPPWIWTVSSSEEAEQIAEWYNSLSDEEKKAVDNGSISVWGGYNQGPWSTGFNWTHNY